MSLVIVIILILVILVGPLVILAHTTLHLAQERDHLRLYLVASENERDHFKGKSQQAYAEVNSLKTTIQRLTAEGSPERVQALEAELAQARQEHEAKIQQYTEHVQVLQNVGSHWADERDSLGEELRVTRQQLAEAGTRVQTLEEGFRNARDERNQARVRVQELESAIRSHYEARGHQKCWLNDQALYAVLDHQLPDTDPTQGRSLPELLAGCTAYWLGQMGMGDLVPEHMELDKKDVMQ